MCARGCTLIISMQIVDSLCLHFCLCFQVTGEVGIIESISLKNFMCHSWLGPFAFGPNVNFVVGNNGSKLFFMFLFLNGKRGLFHPIQLSIIFETQTSEMYDPPLKVYSPKTQMLQNVYKEIIKLIFCFLKRPNCFRWCTGLILAFING